MHGSCSLLLFSTLSGVSLGTFLSGTKKTVPPRDVPDNTFRNLNEIEGALAPSLSAFLISYFLFLIFPSLDNS